MTRSLPQQCGQIDALLSKRAVCWTGNDVRVTLVVQDGSNIVLAEQDTLDHVTCHRDPLSLVADQEHPTFDVVVFDPNGRWTHENARPGYSIPGLAFSWVHLPLGSKTTTSKVGCS